MFGIILTSAVALLHLYVFWRISSIAPLQRHIPQYIFALSGVALLLLFMIGRFYGHDNPGFFAGVLELLAMNWMAILFLCALCLLLVDIVTVCGRKWSRQLSTLRALGLAAGLVLSIIAMVQGSRPPVIDAYEVALAGLPEELEGTVIVAVSDLHLGSRRNEHWLAARIAQIEAERPDLIVLLGDIFEGHGEPAAALRTELAQLHAPRGVWAVRGNHEFMHSGAPQATAITGNELTVLANRWTRIDDGLILAGVDDLTTGRRNGNGRKWLQQALTGRPPGATILLSHSPLYADDAAAAGVGLMLSGHTHGGQIWPFGYLVKLRYPFLAGRYQLGDMTIIVSRGAGSWGTCMRLWQPPEIVRVTLRGKR